MAHSVSPTCTAPSGDAVATATPPKCEEVREKAERKNRRNTIEANERVGAQVM